MVDENISKEFRLKNTDETRNYFLEEIKQNKLMSEKHVIKESKEKHPKVARTKN